MKPILFIIPDWLPLLGGSPIYSYGVMLGLSFILGWYITLYFAEQDELDPRTSMIAIVVAIVFSLFGARLLFFITNPDRYLGLASFMKFDSGGLVAYGGYLGGMLGSFLYLNWFTDIKYFRLVDHAAPQLALGLGLTRVGCYLYGCDFGQRIAPGGGWSVQFPHWTSDALPWVGKVCEQGKAGVCGVLSYCSPATNTCAATGSPAWSSHQKLGYIDAAATASAHIHPVQIYASLNGLVLFAVLLIMHRYRKFHGQLLLTFLAWYALTRFFLERLREDPQRGSLATIHGDPGFWAHILVPQGVVGEAGASLSYIFSTSQFISLLLLVVTGVGFYIAWRRVKDPDAWTFGGLGEPVLATGPAPSPEPEPPKASNAPRSRLKDKTPAPASSDDKASKPKKAEPKKTEPEDDALAATADDGDADDKTDNADAPKTTDTPEEEDTDANTADDSDKDSNDTSSKPKTRTGSARKGSSPTGKRVKGGKKRQNTRRKGRKK